MASKEGLVQYIAEQMSGAGSIRYRKMMGDYCVYCDEKVIGLICDNQLFLKNTPSAQEMLNGLPMACPYKGAKKAFVVEDIDNRDFLAEVVCQIAKDLSVPKKRKSK